MKRRRGEIGEGRPRRVELGWEGGSQGTEVRRVARGGRGEVGQRGRVAPVNHSVMNHDVRG